MKELTFFILLLISVACSTEKTLTQVKLNEGILLINHYENDIQDDERKSHFIVYKTSDSVMATVKVEETKIRITPNNKKSLIPIDTIETKVDLEIKVEPAFRLAHRYSYKNELKKKGDEGSDLDILELDKANNKQSINSKQTKLNSSYSSFNSIKYSSNQLFLQTLTVPFKFRGEVNGKPSSVSTGFNAGFAYGKLWNWQKVTPIYSSEDFKMKGYNKRVFAFGIAPFIGLTTVELTSDNTQETITKDKTVLGGTFGGVAVIKFNSLNVGLGVGADFGFDDSKDWDYQGKPWLGLILGLDLIK